MISSTRKRVMAAVCVMGLAGVGLAGCGDKAKDVASEAQQQVDQAGEAAVNGAKSATEKATAAANDAKAAAKEAADAAKDAAKDAADAAKDGGDKAADAAKDAADAAAKAAQDAADAAKDGAKTGSAAAKDAAQAASDAAAAAVADAKKAAADEENGDMVSVTDAAGASVSIPVALNEKATSIGAGVLGKLVSVKNAGTKWVASYANGWHIAYDKTNGAIPVKGKIGQVWFENGGVTNPVGMPTAAEQTKADGNWVQSFTNGEIWANTDGTAGTVTK